ncbi:MAG: Gfo/Idh/MocA family oxidoreductase [Candidatus Falkowbacteria bacterium]
MNKKTSIVIIGAGSRGLGYAEHIKNYGKNEEVVGVVDPDQERVVRVRILFPEIKDGMIFDDWEKFVSKGKLSDAVVIATQDRMHKDPAIACAALGYHILLEKPMAPTAEDCQEIVFAAKENDVMFTVCHVLRYTKFFQKLREIISSKIIGDIVTVQHFEHVGYWHIAHSYVRGNWRNEQESSFMLLAKSCHDIDILRFLIGKPCRRVQSFGSLFHFRRENKPREAGSAMRCLDCPRESECPYSAVKIYLRECFNKGNKRWPVSVLVNKVTRENLLEALRVGPYGRCVYECDNDVVDHQVVNLEYEGGITAAFTMSGFNRGGRETMIQGTHGSIYGNMADNKIIITDFLTEKTRSVKTKPLAPGFHGGGDEGLIKDWLMALKTGDRSKIITGPDESLETHLTTFLAERSRINGTVESIK